MKKFFRVVLAVIFLSFLLSANAAAGSYAGYNPYGGVNPNYHVSPGSITDVVQQTLNQGEAANEARTYERIGEGIGTIIIYSLPALIGLLIYKHRKSKKQ